MTTLLSARTIGISIERNWQDVYDFMHRPLNFAKWAFGLASDLHQEDGVWLGNTSEGLVAVRFSDRNAYGTLDHWVTPQGEREIAIPLRVIQNGDGAEVMLTLFRQPEMTDELFARDAEWVENDLATLKSLLESERN